MLIPHVVQTEADKIFVNFLNVKATSATAGDPIVWDTGTPDGVRGTQPVTATLSLVMGVVDVTTPASTYGLAQSYGYRAQANVTNDTSNAIAAGDILIPVNAQNYLARSAASDGKTGFVYAAAAVATNTTPAAALVKVFIRAM